VGGLCCWVCFWGGGGEGGGENREFWSILHYGITMAHLLDVFWLLMKCAKRSISLQKLLRLL